VFGNIDQSISINKWNKDNFGALEIFLDNNDKKNIDFIFNSIPSTLDIQKSSERFPEIFSWINLFDTNIYLIIVLMIVVGGINMITALLVTVLDKAKLIGTLKVLGANNNSITKIFMINGFYLISKGVVIGNIISLGLLLIQKQFLFFKLDPNIYYSDYVPIEIAPIKIILFNLLVIFISMLMLLIPSKVISKIKPNSILKLS
jgi:ABC-type transport system, involved in lipoprotein release, permease component